MILKSACSERYQLKKNPTGPRTKAGKGVPVDWPRGETCIFKNRYGNPIQTVDLTHFSQLAGIKTTAGHLRKIFTTELARNKDQVINVRYLYSYLPVFSSFVRTSRWWPDTAPTPGALTMTRSVSRPPKFSFPLFRRRGTLLDRF